MKPRNLRVVSLLEFIKTGNFGDLELGFTKQDVLTKFCKPDDKNYMGCGMSIWRYSLFELHFLDEVLVAFWCDGLQRLKNPSKKQFRLDKWVFANVKILTIDYFCKLLIDLGLIYEIIQLDPSLILLIKDTNVNVYFEDIDENAKSLREYRLIGIGASESYFKQKGKVIEL